MHQVLLVDDDPSQLRIRQAILRSAGLVVHVATSVDSALAFLRTMEKSIGLVVTDHCLPGRSGADLVRELRTTAPRLEVLVLSGMPGIDDEYAGLNVSVRLKPVPPEEFIEFVQSTLGVKKKSSHAANSSKSGGLQ